MEPSMATPILASAPVPVRAPTSGGVREVALLAYPIVLTQMSQTLMHVVDSIFVGQLGAAQLGALGFAGDLALDGDQRLQRHGQRRADLRLAGARRRATTRVLRRLGLAGLYAVVPAADARALRVRRRVPSWLWSDRGRDRPRSASTRSPTRACVPTAWSASASGWCSPPSSAASATRARRCSRRSSRTWSTRCSPGRWSSGTSACRGWGIAGAGRRHVDRGVGRPR